MPLGVDTGKMSGWVDGYGVAPGSASHHYSTEARVFRMGSMNKKFLPGTSDTSLFIEMFI